MSLEAHFEAAVPSKQLKEYFLKKVANHSYIQNLVDKAIVIRQFPPAKDIHQCAQKVKQAACIQLRSGKPKYSHYHCQSAEYLKQGNQETQLRTWRLYQSKHIIPYLSIGSFFKFISNPLFQPMQKDQSDWQSQVPETDKQKEIVVENFPPRGTIMPEAQAKVIAEVETDAGSTAKKPVKSAKNNRLDSKSKYVPFNQSYKSSNEHTFMKVSDIHEGTERYSIMVKVTKQYFYRNNQDIDCTQVTLSDKSGSAWGYFNDSNCRYFIKGSILCIINGIVRIYNNRISLQLNKNCNDSYIYQCQFKDIETDTRYNISHRIIGDRYYYRQYPSASFRGSHRKGYHRNYYEYAQPQRRNSYSRSSSQNSNRSSFHKNIRRDNSRNNQGYKVNKSKNTRNQSKRKNSFRQESSDRFQSEKRCSHMCDYSQRYEKSRKKQYVQKSIQKRSRIYDRNHNEKPRSYHSYLLNRSSINSFSKTIFDDPKNDSIEVKIGNSSTIVSALAPLNILINDPLPIADGPPPEKKDQDNDSIGIQIIDQTIEEIR